MLCERCKNYDAVFHFNNVSNNVQTELHLCNKCAGDINFETRDHKDPLYLKTMFSPINNDDLNNNENRIICMNCGLTDMEFTLYQKPGCPSCYKYFKSIISTLSKTGKQIRQSGKRPHNYIEVIAFRDDLSDQNKGRNLFAKHFDLEEELRIAVIEERYEDAAVLRDKIKEAKVNTVE